MDCAIWLGRKKVFSADDIAENFDIAAIRGYFLGGSLIKWLEAHGGEMYAKALSVLDSKDPALNDRLTEIFVQKKCEVPVHKADEQLIAVVDMLKSGGAPNGSGVCSYNSGSYKLTSFDLSRYGSFANYFGSFYTGSFRSGSFRSGSFSKTWQWEWEWRFGSFRGGSFRFGNTSFGGSYRFNLGSFNFGSFTSGSYRLGSFDWSRLGSLPIGMLPSSYRGVPLGSFRQMTADEYDEIMYRCLNMCPLNRFGYGIHNI